MNPFGGKSGKQQFNLAIPLLISLLFLLIPAVQYYFRKFDNNNFASWRSIFRAGAPVDSTYMLALIAASLFAAFAFRISIPSRLRPPFLFLVSFASAAVLWGIPEGNVDAARYFTQAKHLELYGVRYFLSEWGNAVPAWTDLPLVPFLDGLIFRYLGESRIYIQIFTATFFSLTVVLTSLIGQELWDEETGFYAGALLLGMPGLLIMTPLMLTDVPMMFFLTLSVYLFMHAVREGGVWRSAAAVCSIFLTACSKYSSFPMLTILPLMAALFVWKNEGGQRRRIMQRSSGILLVAALLVGAAAALKYDTIVNQMNLIRSIQLPGMDWWVESYVSTFLFQIHPVIAIAAILSFFMAFAKRDGKYAIVAWLPFLVILFQIKRLRYTVPVFPMVTLMAAYGLAWLKNPAYRKVIVASIVLTSLATSFFAYTPYLNRSSDINLKEAGSFLDSLDIDAVEVYTVPQKGYPINPAVAVPLLDLFTQKNIVYHYVPGASTPDKAFRVRFSWEFRNPAYYTSSAGTGDLTGGKALLIIFGRPNDHVPAELTESVSRFAHSSSFWTYDRQFVFQTLVRVYW